MATDWGDEKPTLNRRLLRRVIKYFLPYWRQAAIALVCIAAGAGLGLVPALVTKGLIDYLTRPSHGLTPLIFLVGLGVGAALFGGLIGVLQSYLLERGGLYRTLYQRQFRPAARPRPSQPVTANQARLDA